MYVEEIEIAWCQSCSVRFWYKYSIWCNAKLRIW